MSIEKGSAEASAATERARWLAELAEAVRQARRLARTLGVAGNDSGPASELYGRLETVRIEIEALRRGGWAPRPDEIDPLRTNPFPWERRHKHWRQDD
ncbi:MAG TPA: hypothetical protein VMN38_07845 [Sphingomicrobium sp.]|nr:hypothetical protein [Sphingomicrobium sp.]